MARDRIVETGITDSPDDIRGEDPRVRAEWREVDVNDVIFVMNENLPDNPPSQVLRFALECEGGMAERGWYEVDPAEAKEAELKGLLKDELTDQAEASGIDTSGLTKDEIRAALIAQAEQ